MYIWQEKESFDLDENDNTYIKQVCTHLSSHSPYYVDSTIPTALNWAIKTYRQSCSQLGIRVLMNHGTCND